MATSRTVERPVTLPPDRRARTLRRREREQFGGRIAGSVADHLTTGGGAILIALVALSYLTGGYVAARMARFDGALS